jgi:sporulation protein YqfC
VVKSSSIINILGNNTIIIENFKTIMSYKSDKIKVKAKDKYLTIYGSKLFIEYYNNEEIKITGRFEQIQFEVLSD